MFHTTPTPTVCFSVPSIVEVSGGCQSVNKSYRAYIPANSPSLVRSLRHFRLARISVRGDRNLRHLSMGFFFLFPAIISYFPVIILISVVGKKQGWCLDEVLVLVLVLVASLQWISQQRCVRPATKCKTYTAGF